jgi:hypothetical protein
VLGALFRPRCRAPRKSARSLLERRAAVEAYATVTDGTANRSPTAADDHHRTPPQSITTFAEGAFPLTVALGVDRSLSMAGEPLRLVRHAAEGFSASCAR